MKDREKIDIWTGEVPGFRTEFGQERPTLEPFLLKDGKPRGAVIICPGGGYVRKAPHEGAPIAEMLNSNGISAFVLDYRVAPYRHPYPLFDLQRAIRCVRANAEKWCIKPDHVSALGFSAGGHLVSTSATHFEGQSSKGDFVERLSSRPDAVVLCYSVISMLGFAHQGSMESLLDRNPSEALRKELSAELQVREDSPPAFLWHTADDGSVPVENSLDFARAMRAKKLDFELHVFPHGRHGLGLAPEDPVVGRWAKLCALWLNGLGFGE